MNYGLIYTVPFATLDNSDCIVEIEKKGYTGASTELTGGASPLVVDIADDEFAYTPLRFSTATINVVGGDYLQELFSTSYQQYRVTLKKNGHVTWCGFIKPELYTQDYSSETFTLELECISAMSTLEFIDYTRFEESGMKFVSFWDLIRKCINSSSSQYNAVYFPQAYGKDASDVVEGNILKEMTVSEQNFFDEDNKPMKLKEVLEEVCKFLHWTCVDWCGSIYFVDIDHKGKYSRYSSDMSLKTGEESIPVKNVQDIGFTGSEHSLDVLPGYTKVTVKTSNYPTGDLDSSNEFDNLTLLREVDSYTPNRDKASRKKIYAPESNLNLIQYTAGGEVLDNLDGVGALDANKVLGALPIQFCTYEQEGEGIKRPKITNYSYTGGIQIRWRFGNTRLTGLRPVVKIKGGCALYKSGTFAFDASFHRCFDDDMSLISKEYGSESSKLLTTLKVGDYWFVSNYRDSRGMWVALPTGEDTVMINGKQYSKYTEILVKNSDSDWLDIINEKTLSHPYDDAKGKLFEINYRRGGNDLLKGEVELTVYMDVADAGSMYGIILKNFSFKYFKNNQLVSNKKSDRLYENVVNESYINELEEIELKLSSYNSDGVCYSKVALGDEYITDNLYSSIEKSTVRPEELLIRRIVRRYSAPQIKLMQVIKETSNLNPISILSDRFMPNKKFINVGGSIDFRMNRFECIMIEI